MNNKLYSILLAGTTWIYLIATAAAGPYAPSETNASSTAYYATSPAFIGWATGHTNYVLGIDESGTEGIDPGYLWPEDAYGAADCVNGDVYWVTTLAGGGQITLTFDMPIANGTGYDFAVFENGFTDGYLELAFVEVSSDGTHFFRFPNDSQTAQPVDAYMETNKVNPTDIHNLAGKYLAGYGTPFDLTEIPDNALLDKNNVRFVKIIDIIGDGHTSDSSGNPIYDPYPTENTPGFDLDAIGIINTRNPLLFAIEQDNAVLCFNALTNRFYRIESTDDLTNPASWSIIRDDFAGNNSLCTVTNTPSNPQNMFYRLSEWYEK